MSAKKKSEDDSESKVFDVAKPGESSPSASSRPIIVNRSGSLKNDPMVTADSDSEASKDETEKSDSETIQTHEKVIVPSKEMIEESKKDSDNSTIENSEDETTETSKDEDGEVENKELESNDSAESEVVDELASEVHTKAQDKKLSEEVARKQAELQKIIDSKKYYVPIRESGPSRSGRRILIVLFLVIASMAIIWFFLAGTGKVIFNKKAAPSSTTPITKSMQNDTTDILLRDDSYDIQMLVPTSKDKKDISGLPSFGKPELSDSADEGKLVSVKLANYSGDAQIMTGTADYKSQTTPENSRIVLLNGLHSNFNDLKTSVISADKESTSSNNKDSSGFRIIEQNENHIAYVLVDKAAGYNYFTYAANIPSSKNSRVSIVKLKLVTETVRGVEFKGDPRLFFKPGELEMILKAANSLSTIK